MIMRRSHYIESAAEQIYRHAYINPASGRNPSIVSALLIMAPTMALFLVFGLLAGYLSDGVTAAPQDQFTTHPGTTSTGHPGTTATPTVISFILSTVSHKRGI
uniref:Uncharacterized protein n=1 Tax=Anopheles farauti TaxID=69004 RepID=A0A182Q3T3_9DIPT